jgi:hypothetical protein
MEGGELLVMMGGSRFKFLCLEMKTGIQPLEVFG